MFQWWPLMILCCYATANDWNGNVCYQNVLKKCEELTGGQISNDTTCEISTLFKDCATKAVTEECGKHDQHILAMYSMSKSSQTALTCFDGWRNKPKTKRSIFPNRCSPDNVRAMGNDCMDKMMQSLKQTVASDEVEENACCAWRQFRACVEHGMYSVCGTEGEKKAEEIFESQKYNAHLSCDKYSPADCPNSASSQQALAAFAILFVAVVTMICR